MRHLTRNLGRIAATAAITATLAGTGAVSAFADTGYGSSTAAQNPSYTYTNHANGYSSWSWTYGTRSSAPSTSYNTWTRPGTTTTTSSSLVTSGANPYWYGNCTHYVFNKRKALGLPVGSNWGNANNWANASSRSGLAVSGTPSVGAILVSTSGYWGHVAIVESLNSNGSITVSEMNWVGFNRVSTRTIAAGNVSSFRYIA